MPLTIYTIGHSNRNIEYLLEILRAMGLQQVVDVRAHPSSVKHPQFTKAYLQRALVDSGITYYWQGSQLGGRRKGRSPSPHHAISSPPLRAYADYTETREFLGAVRELIESASAMRTVLMCAERDPSHCHRSLISDCLVFRGVEVTSDR